MTDSDSNSTPKLPLNLTLRELPSGEWQGTFKIDASQLKDWQTNKSPWPDGTQVFLMPLDWRGQMPLIADRVGRLQVCGTFEPSPYYGPSNEHS